VQDGEVIHDAFCCSIYHTNSRGEILEAVDIIINSIKQYKKEI
jgi:hypothetical protein